MIRNSKMEFGVGLFVLSGMLLLLYVAAATSGISLQKNPDSYRITAYFDNISGLNSRAKVSIAGVTVGRVHSIHIEKDRFRAVVTMDIFANQNQLPVDTGAQILTEGILGAKYINLLPGGDIEFLTQGDVIEDTQGAFILENLISDVVGRLTR